MVLRLEQKVKAHILKKVSNSLTKLFHLSVMKVWDCKSNIISIQTTGNIWKFVPEIMEGWLLELSQLTHWNVKVVGMCLKVQFSAEF